jgi:glycosyltransferase involved in cell wall biosynthesis
LPSPHPDAQGRQALFIQFGSFSHINRSLAAALRVAAPDIAFHVIDLEAEIGKARRLAAAPAVVLERGLGALRGKVAYRKNMLRSRWMQRAVLDVMRREHALRQPLFTIQTQSMFDAGVDGAPHAIYTDHAALARRWSAYDDGQAVLDPAWLAAETAMYRRAARVFTCGSRVRSLLIDDYGVEPAKAVRAGAGPNVQTRPRRRNGGARILFVGVEWERKGGPDLVDAFRQVRERIPQATMTIVGCSPAISVEGVTVMGRVPPTALPDIFDQSDIFCMPSRLEPFGIVYIEALRAGMPIVASNVGDLRDFVVEGENGYLVPAGDVAAIADRLTTLAADPDRLSACSARSLELAAGFGWKQTAQVILREMGVAR